MVYSSFKDSKSEEKRKQESEAIRRKYPDRIPIILERFDSRAPELEKYKYLVPSDSNLSVLLFHIRTRVKLNPNSAIFLTIQNEMCNASEVLCKLYEEKKDIDGFLYITYTTENTFG
jgi:GABA(A) receptor-associated protein